MRAAKISLPSRRLHNDFLANRSDPIPDKRAITVQGILEKTQTRASIFLRTEDMTTFERPVNPARFAKMWGYSPLYNRTLSGSISGVLAEWKDGISLQGTKPKFSSIGNKGGVH
jgi:hypothetical protein